MNLCMFGICRERARKADPEFQKDMERATEMQNDTNIFREIENNDTETKQIIKRQKLKRQNDDDDESKIELGKEALLLYEHVPQI